MADAWDTAFAEAEAELEGETVTEESSETVPVAAEESTTTVEDTPSETVEATEDAAVTTPESVVAKPWWDGLLDHEPTEEELKNGFMRQADYTRKTQEAAELRRAAEWANRLQGALKQDPVGALKQMAVELGLLDAQQEDFRPDEIDPALERLHQVQTEVDELRAESNLLKVQREIDAVSKRYPDFDEEGVLGLAYEAGTRGIPLTIEEAYFQWRGKTTLEKERIADAAKAKAEQEAARLAAARQQSEKVNSGHNPASSGESEKQYATFEDVFEDVWESLSS